MRSLRTWLITSHILPIIIVIPVIGLVLIYLLETQVLLANLTGELEQEAAVTADMAADRPEIWQDTAQAQIFIARLSAHNQSEISLVDSQGNVVASNDPETTDQVGRPLESPNLSTVLTGQFTVVKNYTINLEAEIVEVLYPVSGANQEVVGVVRLTPELTNAQNRFLNLRYLIIGVTIAALIIAASAALFLALKLEKSLRSLTDAIHGVATGQEWTTLPEHKGPKEIRQLSQAFNVLIDRLRSLEETRRRLLANLVHEVGRPIGAVQSAIQALINGADQDPELRRELLDGMATEVERLHPLLDNLAKLHEQVLGTLELNRRPVNLKEWVTHTVIPWREAAHAKGLHWQIDTSNQLPRLNIDSDRLAQVFGNLLSNAIKYTPAGGTVSVSAGVEQKEVWIQVSDTGPGITAEEQTQIFEPFYRSHREQRFPQGMGLGLTIANDLVVAHGGRLVVASEPGHGSQFTVWLPREISTQAAVRAL